MGERVTGGTLYWLNDVVDGGPLADQEHVLIRPTDTAKSLWTRELFPLGIRLFERTMTRLANGTVVAEPQDSSLATWEPSIDKVPPLWRPDVPMLGSSRFQIIPDRREITQVAI
jgi:methionyl-tRNA formyltransferase